MSEIWAIGKDEYHAMKDRIAELEAKNEAQQAVLNLAEKIEARRIKRIDQEASVCYVLGAWSVWFDEETDAGVSGQDWRDVVDHAMKDEDTADANKALKGED